jgi:hypothetical protein
VAFGLTVGPAPDRFLVRLGVLGLLSVTAAAQPVVAVVDDAQWLDRSSAQVLGFVARRLQAESVALLFAVREPSELQELAGLPDLAVESLDDADARALLASVITGRVDEQVVERVIAETRGTPLALLCASASADFSSWRSSTISTAAPFITSASRPEISAIFARCAAITCAAASASRPVCMAASTRSSMTHKTCDACEGSTPAGLIEEA